MSLVAPTPSEFSAPVRPTVRGRLLNDVDKDWSYADWAIAVASVSLAVCSTAFFSWSYVISIESPDYFQQAALARMAPKIDQIETGSVEAFKDAMPAPSILRDRVLVPSDYQIVMIYRDEALLATQDELMRVKVGSVVPGLGTVNAIDGTALGGSITADKATLRSASLPGS